MKHTTQPKLNSLGLIAALFATATWGMVGIFIRWLPGLFIIAYKYVMRLNIERGEGWGILIATVGVIIMLFPHFSSDRGISWQTIVGYLLALGAAGMVTLYTALFNIFTDRETAPKSINIVFMTCLLGGVLFLLCTIFFTKLSLETGINRQEICVLLGLGILSTALPFFCYTVAAQQLPIVLVTSILLLEPMFAVLFASIALREIPSLWFGIVSILVFWGLRSIARAANSS